MPDEKPHYRRWAEVPHDLTTKTQLGKEGLKPVGEPVATLAYGPNREYVTGLYRRSEATPKRKLTEAQQRSMEQTRQRKQDQKRALDLLQELERERQEEADAEERHGQFLLDARAAELEARRALLDFARTYPREDWRILDTETTSLRGEVISLGIVDGLGNILLDTLIHPSKMAISPEAQKIHGISMEDLVGAPAFAEVYPQLYSVLHGKPALAYNAPFDLGRLYDTHLHAGLPWTTVTQAEGWTCLMRLAAPLYGRAKMVNGRYDGHKWLKLGEACWQAAMTLGTLPTDYQRHDALGDTLASLELLNHMLVLAEREEGGEVVERPHFNISVDEMDRLGVGHWRSPEVIGQLEISRDGVLLDAASWWPFFQTLWHLREVHERGPKVPLEVYQDWWRAALEHARSASQEDMTEHTWRQGEWGFRLTWKPWEPLKPKQSG
ncbi:3'-5' exonuclease [Deinococcus roseus]|uniref:Exonuclease domain-containing protein n=1 Tax=Deinococcus roseus TaxID=392414 RepID=A0ABQ2DK84_9DEIO|nr:3'-5' exonuclease [Deinococcus roseus]GGJ59392.1 hypothetical protein GCM10008938_51940 [Deinococcus roseus]